MAVTRLHSRPPPPTNPPSSPLPPLPPIAKQPHRASSIVSNSSSPTSAEIISSRKLGRLFSSISSKTTATPSPRILSRASSSNLLSSNIKPRTTPLPKSIHRSISYNSFPTPPTSLPSPIIVPDLHQNSASQRAVSFDSSLHGLPAPRGIASNPSTPVVSTECNWFPFTSSDTIQEALDEDSSSSCQEGENSTQRTSPISERSSSIADHGGVVVSVRIRPETKLSGRPASAGDWIVDGRAATVSYLGREGGDYAYDNVFTNHDTNAQVYASAAKHLVRHVMEGFHGTVFAYGMTGSGKTYSMQGCNTEPGVIPNAVADIFSFIRETPDREFLLRVSYLEIFNERIYDLLSQEGVQGGTQPENIKLREDSKRGVYASPLKEEIVQTPAQLLRVIAQGHQVRRTSCTQFNSRSSRSHAVIQIVIESRERNATGVQGSETREIPPNGFRVSTLNLIDLAGSERASDSKERRTEGGHINKSLLTLGTIISRLSENHGKDLEQHLPYRDSKLTRLLQSALSGNALISILCTIQLGSGPMSTSSANHTQETLSTLKFAARARNNIVSHAKRTEAELDGRALLAEVLELRKMVSIQKSNVRRIHDDAIAKEIEFLAQQRHSEQMLEMQIAKLALKERIDHLNRVVKTFKPQDEKPARSRGSTRLSHQRQLDSTIDECIQSLSSSKKLSIDTDPTGSIGSIRSGPVSMTSDSIISSAAISETRGSNDINRMRSVATNDLRHQLAEKDRYILSLEEELIETAKNSGVDSTSSSFAADLEDLLVEKDTEIKELRERLADKDRMLTALRTAISRKNDVEAAAVKTVPIALSRYSANSSAGMKSSSLGSQSKPSPRAASPRITQSTGTSPNISSPNPKRIDEMTRLLREMASSISVPASEISTLASTEHTLAPRPLRITLPISVGGTVIGPKSPPTGRFLTPISPKGHLSGWESGVVRKRASLARSVSGSEMSQISKPVPTRNSHPVMTEGVCIGLATPPASPPREEQVLLPLLGSVVV